MRKIFGLAAAVSALAISACNTISGAGQDVSSAGHAVSDTANDRQALGGVRALGSAGARCGVCGGPSPC